MASSSRDLPQGLVWDGGAGTPSAVQRLVDDPTAWATGPWPERLRRRSASLDPVESLLPQAAPDRRDWRDPRVGWGLIVAEPEGYSDAELAAGKDLPEALHVLLRRRGDGPVLRYRSAFKSSLRLSHLRDWKRGEDVALDQAREGTGPGELPAYLLIVGSPREIPWELQFALNGIRFVGRLDLDELGLERYVAALLDDWRQADETPQQRIARARRALIWAVDHGAGDITSLLRQGIALEAHAAIDGDPDLEVRLLDGRRHEADDEGLRTALERLTPGLVITTSHGFVEGSGASLAERLGAPVDQDFRPLDIDALSTVWQPRGAVWYAHACCSAGTCGGGFYQDLFDSNTEIAQSLQILEELGPFQAALPRALLSAWNPARAFIGQVEPTFDWTLRHPETRRRLTGVLVDALTQSFYRPEENVGYGLRNWFRQVGYFYSSWEKARAEATYGEMDASTLLYLRLAARDVQSTVLLGDPTVRLPVTG